MFQKILVPLDGSSRAEQAVPVAAHLARATGGTLVFLEAANPYTDYAPYMSVPVPMPVDTSTDDARAYLHSVAARPNLRGLPTITEVLSGPSAESILAAAREHHADLIVMNSHGRGGLTRWMLGSVAQKVARHAPIPVLILRGESPALAAPLAEGAPPRQVVVPLDGSPLAEAALQPAVEIITALDGPAAVRLLRVIDLPIVHTFPGQFPPIEDLEATAREEVRRDTQAYLAATAERLRGALPEGRRVTIETSVVFAVDVAAAAIEIAEGRGETLYHTASTPATLIVMATHGRGGLARWTMGSITERVLQGTTLPTLVVRPHEVARGETEAATKDSLASSLPRTAPIHEPK
jgi:nucleotide-binding universal stress UspA family protein